MSLVELVVATGLISLITLGTSAVLQQNVISRVKADSSKNTVNELGFLQNAIRSNSARTGACRDFLRFDSATFDVTGQTPLRLDLEGTTYQTGATLNFNGSSFRIDKLYLDQAQLVSHTANDEKVYAATAIAEASIRQNGGWQALPKRSVGTFSIRVTSTQALSDCTPYGFDQMNETICRSISGMQWIAGSQECIQKIASNPDNNFTACPGGTQRNLTGICVPVGSSCYDQYLAGAFDQGVVETCTRLPSNYTASYPAGYTPLPAPGPTGTVSVCTCGSTTIPVGSNTTYCVSCRREQNARPFGESDYYYTVESCGTGGALSQVIGPDVGGQFKVQSDPPSNGMCQRERSPGSLYGTRVVQFR